MRKKLITCIYIKNGFAVKYFNDEAVVETDPVRLAKHYAEACADEIIVFDLSNVDNEHEAALLVIKDICDVVNIPVIGAGNVKCAEDVKKLLHAGCKKAVLNFSREDNVAICEAVSKKYGKDRIVSCIKEVKEFEDNKELIHDYIGEVLFLDEKTAKNSYDPEEEKDSPIIILLPEVSLNRLINVYSRYKNVGITGATVNENTEQFNALRRLIGIEYVPFSKFKLNSDGLIPVIVQDFKTDAVLMLAYMNQEAYEKTIETRTMTYWSRSRQELWVKGLTSGHFQYVKSLTYDCDADTLLARVEQIGAACHTGSYSCFFNDIISYEYEDKNPFGILADVYSVIEDRKDNPLEGSYTNYLFDKGLDKILKKVGEESVEMLISAKDPGIDDLKYEMADFLYYMMILMVEKGVTWEEIMRELANR